MAQRSYDRAPDMIISPGKDYYATFRTERGPICVKLFADKAPETVNNFVFLAREGYFDGTTFHRVIKGSRGTGT
jgi:peptidyl-prolyl cis-trans isomerase B (cyclophilin B)